ncbi:MAG: D-alanine--D-alanine ligase family protein [Clostridiales bacterium]
MPVKTCVAVLFGGQSTEHKISCVSAQYVIQNIDKNKYDVVMIGITTNGNWYNYKGSVENISSGKWEELVLDDMETNDKFNEFENTNILNKVIINGLDKKVDVVFPVLHGINGEDGTIQGFLELAQIPYVGCNVISSAMGMDKCISKIIFDSVDIPQAKFTIVNRSELEENYESIERKIENKFRYPVFVKPSNAGSSVGVTKVHNNKELQTALKTAASYDRKVLVEEFIKGKEVECAVLGNSTPKASVVGEILAANEFYDFEAKYNNSESKTIIPANISDESKERIRNFSIKAYKALECSGLSRVDFFLTDDEEIILNEINTLPGFTSISMYAKLWEATGINYKVLIEKLINFALERFEYCRRKL